MSRGRGNLRLKIIPSSIGGSKKNKPDDPLESEVQKSVVQWAELQRYKGRPLSYYLHHSPNGGKRNAREALKFKKMGVQAGYPDLLLDIPMQGYHGLRIELKRSTNEKLSKHQIERIKVLREEGYCAEVCKGVDEAIDTLKAYMGY